MLLNSMIKKADKHLSKRMRIKNKIISQIVHRLRSISFIRAQLSIDLKSLKKARLLIIMKLNYRLLKRKLLWNTNSWQAWFLMIQPSLSPPRFLQIWDPKIKKVWMDKKKRNSDLSRNLVLSKKKSTKIHTSNKNSNKKIETLYKENLF